MRRRIRRRGHLQQIAAELDSEGIDMKNSVIFKSVASTAVMIFFFNVGGCGGSGAGEAVTIQKSVVSSPVFSQQGGTYSSDQLVSINCTTAGATIRYTTDGSEPTSSSVPYTGPIAISGNGTSMTIKAMAIAPAMTNSTVVSAQYIISIPATTTLFSYPADATGRLIPSSWIFPNGSDNDMYAYDSFTFAADTLINEVTWRGGYAASVLSGPVTDFTITVYSSMAGGLQPYISAPDMTDSVFLARYSSHGVAGETPAGTINGISMYDYRLVLPTPFPATAGVKYWLLIEASQSVVPNWGIASGTGGDGRYFRFSTGLATYQFITGGDLAFSLK